MKAILENISKEKIKNQYILILMRVSFLKKSLFFASKSLYFQVQVDDKEVRLLPN